MGLRMKSFNIFGVHWKIWFLGGGGGGGSQKIEGRMPIKGGWTVCRFKWGLGKKEGVVFLMGVDTPMHAMINV